MSSSTVKINVLLPKAYVDCLDEQAEGRYQSRSELIRDLIRTAFVERENLSESLAVEKRLRTLKKVRGIWKDRKELAKEVSSWRRSMTHRLLK